MEGRRDRVFLATKCGRVPGPDSYSVVPRLSADSVRTELEASLRRLRTDRIDLYQIHWPDPEPEIEEAWSVIADAVKEGKIRYAGVSNFNVAQLRRIMPIHPVTSLQPPYSMLRRDVESEILPFCAENGIGVVCYSPMQMGLLTGSFSRERMSTMAGDDLRTRNPYFAEPALTRNLALVDRLRQIAARNSRSVGELALAWVLRRPEVTCAIVGGRRQGQVRELAGAAGWELLPSEVEEISRALAATGAGA